MTATETRRLHGLRAVAARQLAQRLQAGDAPLAELRELQERVRLIDTVLGDPALQRQARRRALAGSLLAVALLTSLAAAVEMPSLPFSLELGASAAALRMDAAGELGPQALDGELQVEGYSALASADAALVQRARAQRADRIGVQASHLRLRRLAYPAGSLLRLQAGAEAARIAVESPQPPIVVELEMAGPTAIDLNAADGRSRIDYGPGEWLRLVAGDPAAAQRKPPPLTLVLPRRADRSLGWRGLQPTALHFVERQSRGAAPPVFVSALTQARITLPATGAELRLQAGDGLELDGLVLERCELSLGSELRMSLSGSARVMRTRVGAFERSLKPSLLEFLARNHTIELLWGAAAMLWGTTTWLRKQFDTA